MVHDDEVVACGQLRHGGIGESLQGALLPGDPHVRIQFLEALGCGRHRGEAARVIPSDAAQLDHTAAG